MKNRNYLLAALVVAVLGASASALTYIDDPRVYNARISIADLTTDGSCDVEIITGGSVTVNARFDHDGPCTLTLNGGDFTSTVDYKFPDNNTGLPAFIVIYDGTFTANQFESFGLIRDATIEIGANGTFIVESGYQADWSDQTAGQRRWNVAWLIDTGALYASPGYDLVVTDLGGGAVLVTTVVAPCAYGPNPDGTVAVARDKGLSWTAAGCMTSQDVWFTADPNLVTDPNFTTDHPEARIATDITATTVLNSQLNGGSLLAPETTYYWRVDSAGNGGGGSCPPDDYVKDANGIGDLWTFTTTGLDAEILAQPLSEVLPAGVQAVFQVETSQADTIEWYKVGQAQALQSGGDITIEPIDGDGIGILRISNPEGNEGEYYCIVSNAYSQLESDSVFLYTEKLLAHWKFEENLYDEVNGSNDGSAPVEPNYVDSVAIQAGKAADLTGSKFVRVEDSAIGILPKMTVSLWMKANTVEGGGVQAALLRADGAGGDNVDGSVSMRLNSGNIEIRVQGVENLWDAEPQPGLWYHYVGTYDSVDESRMRLYINGVQEGEAFVDERGAEALAHISSLTIGGWNDGTGIVQPFDGQIDDVRIYNYELTPLEIASLYTDWVDAAICLGLSPQAQAVDLVEDCRIDLADVAVLAAQWLECSRVPDCQFDLP